MGYGDDIMATAELRRHALAPGVKAAFGDGHRVHWSEAFANHPAIATREDAANGVRLQWIANYPGCRPYIDYPATLAEAARDGLTLKTARRWHWNVDCPPPEPGEIAFSAAERERGEVHRRGAPYVVIEPTIKARASPNKSWGRERWDAVVAALAAAVRFVQLGPVGTCPIRGVARVVTPGFRDALAALAGARAYVGNEGGLHHAAAALDVPAVVVFGGYISPRLSGYAAHTNLFTASDAWPLGCGFRVPCHHCRAAMAAIAPDHVIEALRTLLEQEPGLRGQEPGTRNQEPGTRNQEPGARSQEPGSRLASWSLTPDP